MPRTTSHRSQFQKSLIALAVGATLAPYSSWALDLAQSPPGTKEPYVAPNVILSLDDSGSMNTRDMIGGTKTRTQVLKESLIEVFSDTSLLPNEKIRFAWQTMGNCTRVGGVAWAPNLDGSAATATTATNKNVMRRLDATHRANFLSYMNNYTACTNTPTHDMVQRADQYMRASLHQNGPWASEPGATASPYLGCRRNFHILLTDGGWNGTERQTTPRNYDNQDITFPNGTQYNRTNTNTNIYRDSENYTTIADWTFKSWSDPLQTSGLTGSITPRSDYETAPTTETFTNQVTTVQATLPKYWNPRYDPATWPHMVTYTVGFSNDALPKRNYTSGGIGEGDITTPSSLLPYDFDGSFAEYANGTYAWRALNSDRGHDMWHAAINSRGRFFAVEKGEDLAKAFRMIIGELSAATEPDRGSTATSGSNASRNDVAKYVANYIPVDAWRGYVEAETVKPDGTTVPTPGWAGKNTAQLIDAMDTNDRVIVSYSTQIPDPATGTEKGGVPFRWAANESNLSTAQKNLLNLKSNGTSDTLGEDRLNYIRGDRTKEGTAIPANYTITRPFRERKSRQGDIVHSEVWYVGAPSSNYPWKGYAAFTRTHKTRLPMIYVGGNDGMLHAFSGTDGSEKLAYVPKGVIPAVGRLADTDFNDAHRYYVDGSAMSGDVDTGTGDPIDDLPNYTPNWRTLLVGALGAGGKGYFVLDVTNPGTTAPAAGNFTESNAQTLVVMDKTRHASETVTSLAVCNDALVTPADAKEACLAAADMGHIFAKPVLDEANPQRTTQIVRMNNNRWAAVMGNGYNSKSGRPVLLIQYLDAGPSGDPNGNMKLLRLVATGSADTGSTVNTTDNGLSAPRLVDLNSDGRPDVAYAGDMKGNLWKFLIADSSDANWGVARWGTNAATTTNHTTAGVPLFTATGGTEGSPNSRTLAQPIVAVPTVRANDRKKQVTISGHTKTVAVGGMMVAFGTGRNVTTNDPQNANVQSLYSVLDNTSYKLIGTKKDRVAVCADPSPALTDNCKDLVKSVNDLPKTVTQGDLVARDIPSTPELTRDGHQYWTVNAATAMDWTTKKGWYMDLPQTRERLLKPMEFYDGSNLMAVFSQVPAKGSLLDPVAETCEAGAVVKEQQFLTLINIMDGKPPSVQILDTNGDGTYNLTSDKGTARVSIPPGSPTLIKRLDKMRLTSKKADGSDDNLDLATFPEQSMRPSWRQLR